MFEIINITELINGAVSGITSFTDAEKAEGFFKDMAEQNGCEDPETALESGCYECGTDYAVFITWSQLSAEEVQDGMEKAGF